MKTVAFVGENLGYTKVETFLLQSIDIKRFTFEEFQTQKASDFDGVCYIFPSNFILSFESFENQLYEAFLNDYLVIINQASEGWAESLDALNYYEKILTETTSTKFVKENVFLITGCCNINEEQRQRVSYKICSGTWLGAWLYQFFDINIKHKHEDKKYRFLSLNRIPKVHRLILCRFLKDEIKDNAVFSMFLKDVGYSGDRLHDGIGVVKSAKWIPEDYREMMLNSLSGCDNVTVDITDGVQNPASHLTSELLKQSYINIVTESMYTEDDIFFSEKIFKPIIASQPFILVSTPGSLAKLRSMGFKTFPNFINEDYDNIVDPFDRMMAILDEIDRLNNIPEEKFKELFDQTEEIRKHNKKVLASNYRSFIEKNTDALQFSKDFVRRVYDIEKSQNDQITEITTVLSTDPFYTIGDFVSKQDTVYCDSHFPWAKFFDNFIWAGDPLGSIKSDKDMVMYDYSNFLPDKMKFDYSNPNLFYIIDHSHEIGGQPRLDWLAEILIREGVHHRRHVVLYAAQFGQDLHIDSRLNLKKLNFFYDQYNNYQINKNEYGIEDREYLFLVGKPKIERMALLAELNKRDLLRHGHISAFGNLDWDQHNSIDNITEEDIKIFGNDLYEPLQNLRSLLPLTVTEKILDWGTANLQTTVLEHFEKTKFSIISETHYSKEYIGAFTEKTFRQIRMNHPFYMLAPPGSGEILKRYVPSCKHHLLLDIEEYDNIEHISERLEKIVSLIERRIRSNHK